MGAEATGFRTDLWVVVLSHVFTVSVVQSGETGQETGFVIPSATVSAAR